MGSFERHRHRDAGAAAATLHLGDGGGFLVGAAVDRDRLTRDEAGCGRDGNNGRSHLRRRARTGAACGAHGRDDGGFARRAAADDYRLAWREPRHGGHVQVCGPLGGTFRQRRGGLHPEVGAEAVVVMTVGESADAAIRRSGRGGGRRDVGGGGPRAGAGHDGDAAALVLHPFQRRQVRPGDIAVRAGIALLRSIDDRVHHHRAGRISQRDRATSDQQRAAEPGVRRRTLIALIGHAAIAHRRTVRMRRASGRSSATPLPSACAASPLR